MLHGVTARPESHALVQGRRRLGVCILSSACERKMRLEASVTLGTPHFTPTIILMT